jgi:hypothetical protein
MRMPGQYSQKEGPVAHYHERKFLRNYQRLEQVVEQSLSS